MKLASLVMGALVVSACGNSDGGLGGVSYAGRGGRPGQSPVTSGGAGGNTAIAAPRVTITSPVAVESPSSGPVLIDDEVDVTCRVEPGSKAGSAPLDPGSIRLELLDAAGVRLAEKPGVATGMGSEYGASFVLAELESGRVAFRCRAADRASPPKTGTDTVETFFDAGPLITIKQPLPDSAERQGPLRFEFVVTPDALADDDTNAEVSEVGLEVNGVELELEETNGGRYVAEVDLTDEAIFRIPPSDSVPVTIRAVNARGVERRETYSFTVDGVPPLIQLVRPLSPSVLGGRVDLEFRVTDVGVGVDRDTIVVELNEEEFRYDSASWGLVGDVFTFTFDSVQVADSAYQITVNIRASDLAGNEESGESALYYVDDVAPYVGLDPLPVREVRTSGALQWCSQPFDPLGDAIDDWENASEPPPSRGATLFRAMVWDSAYIDPDAEAVYISGVETAFLYLQDDESAPFLVDRSGDGICDDIEGRADLPFQKLDPVRAHGTPAGGPLDFSADPAIPTAVCDENATAEANPRLLCAGNAGLTRIIDHSAGSLPVIFAVEPLASEQAPACAGNTWSVANVVDEGWVCAAVIAEDKAGNVGLSKPLRFCLSDGVAPAADCESASSKPPSCMSGCDLDSGQTAQPRLIVVKG